MVTGILVRLSHNLRSGHYFPRDGRAKKNPMKFLDEQRLMGPRPSDRWIKIGVGGITDQT